MSRPEQREWRSKESVRVETAMRLAFIAAGVSPRRFKTAGVTYRPAWVKTNYRSRWPFENQPNRRRKN